MESLGRNVKIGLALFAALLLIMTGAFGGLVLTRVSNSGGVNAMVAAAKTTVQTLASNSATATSSNNQTTTAGTLQQATPTQPQNGVADARYAARTAGPAVVTVINKMQATTTGRGRFGFNGVPGQGTAPTAEASGSGVIIDSQGDIITNQHVVANNQSLEVIFQDGTQVPATLVGADAFSDIAVIKVSAKVPAVAQLGNSDSLQVGQPVVAIGTALGNYQNTVTEGIVSGLHRQLGDGSTSTQDMIQTDAAINHGNSGGPLVDLNGVVMGINTAVVSTDGAAGDIAQGLGFAIPVNTAKNVAEQLMKSGAISHPFIGITYEVITPQVAQDNNLTIQQGVYVTDVASGSPAEKAGIQPNSIITKFDGVALNSSNSSTLSQLVSSHKVGDSVTLTVVAPGSSTGRDVTVVLAERPNGQ